MLEILAFLVIGLMISITINLALLCIMYIQWEIDEGRYILRKNGK